MKNIKEQLAEIKDSNIDFIKEQAARKSVLKSLEKELADLSESEREERLVLRIGHPDADSAYSMYDRKHDVYFHPGYAGLSSRKKFKYGVEDFRDDSMKNPDAETFNKAINDFHAEHPDSRLIKYETYVWFKGVNVVIHDGNLSRRTILPKKRERVLKVDGVGNLKECMDIYETA